MSLTPPTTALWAAQAAGMAAGGEMAHAGPEALDATRRQPRLLSRGGCCAAAGGPLPAAAAACDVHSLVILTPGAVGQTAAGEKAGWPNAPGAPARAVASSPARKKGVACSGRVLGIGTQRRSASCSGSTLTGRVLWSTGAPGREPGCTATAGLAGAAATTPGARSAAAAGYAPAAGGASGDAEAMPPRSCGSGLLWPLWSAVGWAAGGGRLCKSAVQGDSGPLGPAGVAAAGLGADAGTGTGAAAAMPAAAPPAPCAGTAAACMPSRRGLDGTPAAATMRRQLFVAGGSCVPTRRNHADCLDPINPLQRLSLRPCSPDEVSW